MAILITGGAGFIGSHLARSLVEQGERVVVLDNFDPYYDPAIKRARIEQLGGRVAFELADICQVDQLEAVFQKHAIEKVVHLAGLSSVRYSINRDLLYMQVNLGGTMNVLEMCKRFGVRHFVLASTSSIYGQTTKVPFQEEDAADRPLASYPASKRSAELFAHVYHNLYGLDVTILRFFNVYGEDGRPDMMPIRTLESIVYGHKLTLWNAETLKRDWTYVADTVAGIVAALNRPMGFMTFNLGYGSPVSLAEFVHIYEELVGRKAVAEHGEAPPSEPLITYCDNTRAKALLGFAPQVPLAQGLMHVWNWFKAKHGL